MPLPSFVEGRLASLADVTGGTVTVNPTDILTNNTVLASGTQTIISQNVPTTIVTLPANGIRYLTQIICTGEVNAKWDVYINSTWTMTKRTTDRTVDFCFTTPLKVNAHSVIDVKATHHGPEATADFAATILGYTP